MSQDPLLIITAIIVVALLGFLLFRNTTIAWSEAAKHVRNFATTLVKIVGFHTAHRKAAVEVLRNGLNKQIQVGRIVRDDKVCLKPLDAHHPTKLPGEVAIFLVE
jgi:hypothetical protein